MAFGIGHGRALDPGPIGVTPRELGTLPDDAVANPDAGRIDPRRWFAHPPHPLEVEIGSGKGTFLLNQAPADPSINYLGIERAGEFYAYAADRIRRRALPNVRILHADATEFLRWRCPARVTGVIHLYYSDPWPKRKHHKHRVIQDRFLADVWRVLEPGGELRIVTDHDELWEWDTEHFGRWCSAAAAPAAWNTLRAFLHAVDCPDLTRESEPAGPVAPFALRPFLPPAWVGDGEVVGTNYERKMCAGRPPHAAVLRKQIP